MQRPQTLLAALFLGIAFAPHSGGTVWPSNGSEANVQAIHDTNAHDGDTITLPAGTFVWTTNVTLTKGITVSGQTTITGAGTANCTANDQTIIVDELSRTNSYILRATSSAGKSFRLTGVTFRWGSINQIGSGGAIRLRSVGLAQSVRVDHCHFDNLNWGYVIQLGDWIYGVEDHNLIECVGAGLSHRIEHDAWGGAGGGNGSWADYPYFGSEKFWFIETNTIKGSGTAATSGITDAGGGGRYVVRNNFIQNTSCGGHGTEDIGPRGLRCDQVYNNTFYWTIQHGDQFHRSGNTIWHDNTFLGRDPGAPWHTTLVDYRQTGNSGYNLNIWGLADGVNPWDVNDDAHNPYRIGTAASNTTQNGPGATFTTGTTMTPNQFVNMELRNENPASTSYRHSALISSNTATTITYTMPFRSPQLVFNVGDAFAVRKVLISLDQGGRGKGDLVGSNGNP